MAAPGHSDIVYYEGTAGAPNDNDSAIIGAITTDVIAMDDLDKTINTPPFDTTPQEYFGGFYIKQNASGSLTNARVYNRCGMKPNPIVGTVTIGFSGGQDEGKKVRLIGLVSGVIQTEIVVCPDGAGFTSSSRTYDEEGLLFAEFLSAAEATDKPIIDITISQSGVPLGVMRGTAGNGSKDLAVRQLCAFQTIALADTKNTTVSSDDRKTAPDDISAFDVGARWTGLDESLAVPSNVLEENDYIGVVVRLEIPANFPTPAWGRIQIGVCIVGNAVA